MLRIDCSELSADEKLALASAISDKLEGRALALSSGDAIVLDQLTDESLSVETVKPIVADFISRRKDGPLYSLELHGETIVVRSADPVRSMRQKTENTLPPNLKQCPMCSFITQYDEEYTVHVRSHYFGV